ncbi:hypothetical protein [Streptomyces sp. MAR4 CNX-425]|uniref:hypothetical protein n=1 Tax=Streptomyces sp. MAR4 CNX-425 TaxID=3406343 RepID=UPI003B513AB6
MRDGTALGDFPRTRRGGCAPADVGLPSYRACRVPGLRRGEPARPRGVRVTYCTRPEPGQNHQTSPSVIEALGDASGHRIPMCSAPDGSPAHPARQLPHLTTSTR